jgi:hypothetical protein
MQRPRQDFEPFFTTMPQGDEQRPWLGVIDAIIKQHGGGIPFTSNGKGTNFPYHLPATTYQSRRGSEESAGIPTGGRKPFWSLTMKQSISPSEKDEEMLHYRVYCAGSAKRPSHHWEQKGTFDRVILDILCPEWASLKFDALRWISPDLPVVPGERILCQREARHLWSGVAPASSKCLCPAILVKIAPGRGWTSHPDISPDLILPDFFPNDVELAGCLC